MKKIVISLGGSLIWPNEIDEAFILSFRDFLIENVKTGLKFFVICGGGSIARAVQKKAQAISKVSKNDLDELGIMATKVNSSLLKSVLPKDLVHEKIFFDPTKNPKSEKAIIIYSGWKPGWSTDYDAVLLAHTVGIDSVINMSNIDFVYSADPKIDKSAKPLKITTWQDYRSIIDREWTPGLSTPFDPVAAKFADENKMQVKIIGKSIENIQSLIDDKDFVGTLIK